MTTLLVHKVSRMILVFKHTEVKTKIFQENASENAICKMSAILIMPLLQGQGADSI